jgi:hypothetical protein
LTARCGAACSGAPPPERRAYYRALDIAGLTARTAAELGLAAPAADRAPAPAPATAAAAAAASSPSPRPPSLKQAATKVRIAKRFQMGVPTIVPLSCGLDIELPAAEEVGWAARAVSQFHAMNRSSD